MCGGFTDWIFLQKRYKEETFVHVMDKGGIPHTRHVRGSNYNLISVFPDRISGRAIIISGDAATISVCFCSASHGSAMQRTANFLVRVLDVQDKIVVQFRAVHC